MMDAETISIAPDLALGFSEHRETIEFCLPMDAFEASFPGAFTLANPEPKFTLNDRGFLLTSFDWPSIKEIEGGQTFVRCRALELRQYF